VIDEVFDDEAADDDTEAAPKPDLTHVIAGVSIGFRQPKRGQLVALSRVRDAMSRQLRQIQADRKTGEREKFEQASSLVMRLDLAILELVESMIISEQDLEYVKSSLLSGQTDLEEIAAVIFSPRDTVEDDADPAPVVTSKKPARKVAARKVANANRTSR
jgi:hypothetical protein